MAIRYTSEQTVLFDEAVNLLAAYLQANVDEYFDRPLGAHNEAKRVLWPALNPEDQSSRVLR